MPAEIPTTEAQAKEAYETWIFVIDDSPKPWDQLSDAQRAIWINGVKDMQNV